MKSAKSLIIAGVALVVIVGAFFAVRQWLPEPDSGPGATTSQYVNILDIDGGSLRTFEVYHQEKKINYTMVVLDRGSSYSRAITLRGKEELQFDGTKMWAAINGVCVSRTKTVIENPENLADYGLEPAKGRIVITQEDGTVTRLEIGNKAPLNDGYYVRLENDTSVYSMSVSAVENVLKQDGEYRMLELLPDPGEDYAYVGYVHIINSDTGMEMELRTPQTEEIKLAGIGEVSELMLVQPVRKPTRETNVKTLILDPIFGMSAPKVIEDYPKDLSIYGLDDPSVLEIGLMLYQDADSEEFTLEITKFLIGGKTDRGFYIMYNDVPTVFEISGRLSYMDVDYFDIMERTAWLHSILEVSQVVIQGEGEIYTLEIDDSLDKEHVFSAFLNGSAITEKNAKELYTRALSFSIEGLNPNLQVRGQPDYRLTYVFKDGRELVISLYNLNDRSYAVQLDEREIDSYVNVRNIEFLFEGLRTMASGGTLR